MGMVRKWRMWRLGYVCAKRGGAVQAVSDGRVVVDGKTYSGLAKTFVQPQQIVSKGAIIGRR
jgi:hypothetical protein